MPPELPQIPESTETTPEQRFRDQKPDFPLLEAKRLEAGDFTVAARLAHEGGWLGTGEQIAAVSIAGEGNMNLTLRVRTDRRSLIVKQSRPWVEKYPRIEAPFDRSLVEETFYRVAARITGVAGLMPELIASQPEYRLLVLEDLGSTTDFAQLYQSDAPITLEEDDLDQLSRYLELLHAGSRELIANAGLAPEDLAWLRNRDMRQLNWQHIFVIPLTPDNGLELDGFEPGLSRVAARLSQDSTLGEAVVELGRRYLADGETLLHGDYFPGSWLETSDGVRIIDPEFAFLGDAEFDYAVAVAHLCMTAQPWSLVERLLPAEGLDSQLVAQFAGVEIIRRLIGVAQLPIPPSDGHDGARMRADLLERARDAIVQRNLEVLRS